LVPLASVLPWQYTLQLFAVEALVLITMPGPACHWNKLVSAVRPEKAPEDTTPPVQFGAYVVGVTRNCR
jgi:hypothetical protein